MWWQRDDVVDSLIENNRARPRPGMDKPDLAILARSGYARWTETMQAQARQQTLLDAPPTGQAALPF